MYILILLPNFFRLYNDTFYLSIKVLQRNTLIGKL